MPIYEYRCAACEHTFEVMQKFSDPPVRRCPKCKRKVEKLLSPPGLLFKGTGWYVTDYSDSRKKAKAKEAEKKPPEGGDAKPAEKPEKAEKASGKGSGAGKGSS